MSHEGAPQPTGQQASPLINQDGSINEDVLRSQFGLGMQEATQQVTFGSYTGTVAEMLSDARCPVGGMISKSFQERGIEGVVDKFRGLSVLDENFSIKISEETLVMGGEASVKKKPNFQNP